MGKGLSGEVSCPCDRSCLKMKVCCVLSLETPHGGDSNKYIQHTIFNIKKKIRLKLWDISKGLKIEFETAMVNEPSVFEPLKFHCISF